MRLFTFLLIISAALILGTACGESSSEDIPESAPLSQQVQMLVDQDRFEEALDRLRSADQSQGTVLIMLRDTHLHYGNYLMYDAETIHMTERMPKALRHFRRVLELDPENRQARSNIDQIEGIYQQMGRDIPEGVAE